MPDTQMHSKGAKEQLDKDTQVLRTKLILLSIT